MLENDKQEQKGTSEKEIESLMNYIHGFQHNSMELMNSIKNSTNDIHEELVSNHFRSIFELSNNIHAVFNNFMIVLTDYIPPKTYSGQRRGWEDFLDTLNDIILFLIQEPHALYDHYFDQLHLLKLEYSEGFEKSTQKTCFYHWHYKLIHLLRSIVSKLNNCRIKLLKYKHDIHNLFMNSGNEHHNPLIY